MWYGQLLFGINLFLALFIESIVTQKRKRPQRVRRSLRAFHQTLENLHTSCCLDKGRKHLKRPLKTQTQSAWISAARKKVPNVENEGKQIFIKTVFNPPPISYYTIIQLNWMYVGSCVRVIALNAFIFLMCDSVMCLKVWYSCSEWL